MKGLLEKLTDHLLDKYIKIRIKEGAEPFSKDCEKKLSSMSPGKAGKQLVKEYYKKKLFNETVAVLAVMFIMVAVVLSNLTNKKLNE